MDVAALNARKKEIEAARDLYVNEANQRIGAYAGAIAELDYWIDLEISADAALDAQPPAAPTGPGGAIGGETEPPNAADLAAWIADELADANVKEPPPPNGATGKESL